MIKIPQQSKFSQTNKSDLFGNIYYTKGINFNELGYLKQSSRAVSIYNTQISSDFLTPTTLARASEGGFSIVTQKYLYNLALVDGLSSFVKDTTSGFPTLDGTSYGKYWINRLHVTNNTKMYYVDTSGFPIITWTDSGITLTTGKPHPMAVFEKAGTFMVANGNLIQQLNTSYSVASLAQLTIPSDYEIVGIEYNNNMLGIATRFSSTVAGQNKEAKLFIWDGSASSANASYACGSDSIIAIKAYKSSFVILTRTGELKYFNGGGFETIATFPCYNNDVVWGDFTNKIGFGDMLEVEGDLIYINVNSSVTTNKLDNYIESMPGGIWCYDPEVGLYHTKSPSVSQMSILYVAQADVNTTEDRLTITNVFSYPVSPTIPETGNPVKVTSSTIGGLDYNKIYYIIKTSSTSFKLALTKEDAENFNAVDLTSQGGGASTFMVLDIKDYGQAQSYRPGGVALMGLMRYTYDGLIFGSEIADTNSATNYPHLNLSVAGFRNINYFVTGKVPSQNVEDNIQKLYLKYRPLKESDSIIVKYKNKDELDIPELASCTVTSSTVLTTTSKIPRSYEYTEELECEIISGSGAGQMSKIASITENSGTYTITLEESLDGLVASDVCTIKIDNWTELETITGDSSVNWTEIAVAKNSKWTKFKIVLDGSDITIEELLIINSPQLQAK